MAKYYLVGELHGTNEAPEACWNILKKNKIRNLALEFPSEYQEEVNKYLYNKRKLDNLSIFQVTYPHDGRASNAIKRLLEKAKRRSINVYLVDSSSEEINQREKEMAKNLIKIKDKVVFLCGDAHASKKEYKFNIIYRVIFMVIRIFSKKYPKLEKTMKPCGVYLPSEETTSYKVIALEGGNFYNFKVKTAKRYNLKINKFPKIIKSPDTKYDIFYIVRRFTHSK